MNCSLHWAQYPTFLIEESNMRQANFCSQTSICYFILDSVIDLIRPTEALSNGEQWQSKTAEQVLPFCSSSKYLQKRSKQTTRSTEWTKENIWNFTFFCTQSIGLHHWGCKSTYSLAKTIILETLLTSQKWRHIYLIVATGKNTWIILRYASFFSKSSS